MKNRMAKTVSKRNDVSNANVVNAGFDKFNQMENLREILKDQGFKEKPPVNLESKKYPQLKLKVKSFKFTKDAFLKNEELVKKVKDLTRKEINNICTFEINGYVFHIKEKISTNPKNFLIWIKGKNDTNFVDFKKFVIIGKNHKLLAGEELEQENIRRALNHFMKKAREAEVSYKRLSELNICTASDDDEIIKTTQKMENMFVELAENVRKLSELYFKNCVSKDPEIKPIYKNKEHKQKVQLFLQRMWENGIAV